MNKKLVRIVLNVHRRWITIELFQEAGSVKRPTQVAEQFENFQLKGSKMLKISTQKYFG